MSEQLRTYTCSQCNQDKTVKPDRRGDFRLPNDGPKKGRWKDVSGQLYCGTCFKHSFVTRSVTMPVYQPLGWQDGRTGAVTPITWQEFRQSLRPVLLQSTCLANWAVQELFRRDAVRTPSMPQPPPMPEVNLYQLFQNYPDRDFWAGATQSANCIFKAVERAYAKQRREIFYHRDHSRLTYGYPYPFPVHCDAWQPLIVEDSYRVSLSYPGQRVLLECKSDPQFWRQLQSFRHLLENPDLRGECKLDMNRHGQVLLRLSGYFVRKEKTERKRVMVVTTDPNAFWVVEVDGRREPWILNADHVRGRLWQLRCAEVRAIIANHTSFRQRMSEDLKYEKRWPKRRRRQMLHRLQERCAKNNDRVKAFNHEASSILIAFAERQEVGKILYCDDNHDFFRDATGNELPYSWHDLREKVVSKGQMSRIEVQHVTSNASDEEVN